MRLGYKILYSLKNKIRPSYDSDNFYRLFNICTHTFVTTKRGIQVDILNEDTEYGFTLNIGFGVLGALVIFPRTVFSWTVQKWDDINEAALSLFLKLNPPLGSGDVKKHLPVNVVNLFQKQKINIEVLPTDQACGIFNFLNAEQRFIAAALLPIIQSRPTEDDLVFHSLKQKLQFLKEE